MYHLILSRPTILQAEIEALKDQIDVDNRRIDDPQRLFQEFLACLVSLKDDYSFAHTSLLQLMLSAINRQLTTLFAVRTYSDVAPLRERKKSR